MHPHTLTHGIHASQQMQCRSELNDKALLNKKKKLTEKYTCWFRKKLLKIFARKYLK